MINIYQRQAAAFRNELRTSCAALMGIVQGLLADGHLNDQEIKFLREWLKGTEVVCAAWPGNVIYSQVEAILADGVISTEERDHLSETLRHLIGGRLDDVAEAGYVSEMPFNQVESVDFVGRLFCFTGDFVFGPRNVCESAVERRGGAVTPSVTKKLHYLVVGGLGSPEWKHGSYGTKIEKAVQYRQSGLSLQIVHEDVWASALGGGKS